MTERLHPDLRAASVGRLRAQLSASLFDLFIDRLREDPTLSAETLGLRVEMTEDEVWKTLRGRGTIRSIGEIAAALDGRFQLVLKPMWPANGGGER